MKILTFVFLTLMIALMQSCQSKNCESIPNTFTSYEEATQVIENSFFSVAESVDTSKSSWIRGAKYYSCDGQTGYFLLKTNKPLWTASP